MTGDHTVPGAGAADARTERREREAQSPQTRGTLSRIYYDSLLIQIRYRFFSFSSTLFLHKLFCGIALPRDNRKICEKDAFNVK